MKVSLVSITAVALISNVHGFAPLVPSNRQSSMVLRETAAAAMADSGVPPATSAATDVTDMEIPINLPSDCGMDYIPLATMLATGQLAEADQVCLVEYKIWAAFFVLTLTFTLVSLNGLF
jgi:hypothetical protein